MPSDSSLNPKYVGYSCSIVRERHFVSLLLHVFQSSALILKTNFMWGVRTQIKPRSSPLLLPLSKNQSVIYLLQKAHRLLKKKFTSVVGFLISLLKVLFPQEITWFKMFHCVWEGSNFLGTPNRIRHEADTIHACYAEITIPLSDFTAYSPDFTDRCA